jgi:hypothetical protein
VLNFFEKKAALALWEANNSCFLSRALLQRFAKKIKVFWFFFSKKNAFLTCLLPAHQA